MTQRVATISLAAIVAGVAFLSSTLPGAAAKKGPIIRDHRGMPWQPKSPTATVRDHRNPQWVPRPPCHYCR